MRMAIGVAAFLAPVALVMSAMAQPPGSDTVRGMVERSATFLIDTIAYSFEPKADGRYAGGPAEAGGSSRIEGKALCVRPERFAQEIRLACRDGKSSGDTFEVAGLRGPVTVTVR